jgi:gamma-glutamyl:cysteine ligase YbdK (ATP-grasp superfamily)
MTRREWQERNHTAEFRKAVEKLWQPPIPEPLDFLREEWWKVKPNTTECSVKELELRVRQITEALMNAYIVIDLLSGSVGSLERRFPEPEQADDAESEPQEQGAATAG